MPDRSKPDPAKLSSEDRPEIPSREEILACVEKHPRGMSHARIGRALDIYDPERFEGLRRRLIAMCRDGQLTSSKSGRYIALSHVVIVKGTVQGHRDGYGFLVRDDGQDDLYLSAHQMRAVFPGDRVSARVDDADPRGRVSGIIVDVLDRATRQLVGRYFTESNYAYVDIEDPKVNQRVMIEQGDASTAEHGQYVTVEITRQPSAYERPLGKVVEVLGDYGDPGMEIEVAIRQFDIPHIWPQAVLDETALLKPRVEGDFSERKDLRALPLITIDGEDARDFDDAVYCEPSAQGGWTLFVAIADVSHYVTVSSALNDEARNRGTSVYFPQQVVPMLPEILSNGLCSLNPLVDRLCMVCELHISEQGELKTWQFYEAIMHSKARLTYNKVASILLEPETPEGQQLCEDYQNLLPHLHHLFQLYTALTGARTKRQAIDFETTETQVIFDENRKIDAIEPVVRNEAHKIIEECMLCANVAAALFLADQDVPFLYRIHEPPTQRKLENLSAYLSELGLSLGGGEKPAPGDYQYLNHLLQGREDKSIIQTMMLRSMSQARYGAEDAGHFGLAYPAYTHFTSPIRRYPDLLVHRAIKYANGKKTQQQDVGSIYPYDLAKVIELGEHCSLTERRADEATRDVMSWLKCEFLEERIGERFQGLVAAVTSFGFFVELEDLYIEGLVHISALGDDYYQFDKAKQRLTGERTGRRFGLGDRVEVQIARVGLEDRQIDLALVDHKSQKRSKRKQSAKNRKALLDALPPRDKKGGKGSSRSKLSKTSDSVRRKERTKGGRKKS